MRPNLFVNTPDILTEYLQFGGRPRTRSAPRSPRPAHRCRASTPATSCTRTSPGRGPRRTSTTRSTSTGRATGHGRRGGGNSLAPYLTRLNEIRRAHPALRQLRNIRFHWSDDDAVLVYSKHLDAAFTGTGLERHDHRRRQRRPASVRQTTVHLDTLAWGVEPGDAFEVDDLITGSVWTWTDHNFVRLDAFTRARAHPAREGAAMTTRLRSTPPCSRPWPRARYHDPHSVLGAHPQAADRRQTHDDRARPAAAREERRRAARRRAVWSSPTSGTASGRASPARSALPARGDLRRRRPTGTADAVPVPPDRRRARPAPVRRGPARAALGDARRAPPRPRRHRGTAFAVWAPHAQAVRVIGDFNGWDGRLHAMRRWASSGVWELFVPGLDVGALQVRDPHRAGEWIQKADPMARHAEPPPATASVVTELQYRWGDSGWMTRRAATNPSSSRSASTRCTSARGAGARLPRAADQLIDYLHETGYTHVEFLPLAEHPYGGRGATRSPATTPPRTASATRTT